MGRFDALTQMEEKPQTPPPSVAIPSPASKPPPQELPVKDIQKKPANPQTRKPANTKYSTPSTHHSATTTTESPEKYSTRLEPSMVKKIKVYAAEKDLKDYEVVKLAMTEYFQRNS